MVGLFCLKDILLPSETFSPKHFEKLYVVLSSDQVGVFTLEIVNPNAPVPTLGSCQIRMEDLLQAKFENKVTLDMFDQVARVRVNTLIFLINKSELKTFHGDTRNENDGIFDVTDTKIATKQNSIPR